MRSTRATGVLTLAFVGGAFVLPAFAANGVQTITVNDRQVHMTSEIPGEFFGTYRYEREGEPIIELRGDGTGLFQAHGIAPIPIRYWLRTDANGKVERAENPTTGSYRVTIVLQYGQSTNGNYPTGGYDMWYLTFNAEDGCFNILGERFKC